MYLIIFPLKMGGCLDLGWNTFGGHLSRRVSGTNATFEDVLHLLHVMLMGSKIYVKELFGYEEIN